MVASLVQFSNSRRLAGLCGWEKLRLKDSEPAPGTWMDSSIHKQQQRLLQETTLRPEEERQLTLTTAIVTY
jgi:hypothetical protein